MIRLTVTTILMIEDPFCVLAFRVVATTEESAIYGFSYHQLTVLAFRTWLFDFTFFNVLGMLSSITFWIL